MHEKSLTELRAALAAKECSAVELAQLYLKRIDAAKSLNAFVQVDADLTLEQAKAADALLPTGHAGPLVGLPIAHKDVFVTRGWRSTAGSKMLANYASPFDATVVERLKRAGMVCVGKTNMDEFAMGSSNENSHFGPVRNPWDRLPVPGGASGGSGAAVAPPPPPAPAPTDTGGGLGRGSRRAPRAGRDRHRHGRFDPPARFVHRRDRDQADLWPRVALRH